jgi:hypothetical protein
MINEESNKLELKYIDQGHDGVEGWIRHDNGVWIRLDFILEYFLFHNVDVTRQYKNQLIDKNMVVKYCESMFKMFSEETSNGSKFDFNEYLEWKNNNQSEIRKAYRMLMQ